MEKVGIHVEKGGPEKRFGREHPVTMGIDAITPARYRVVSHVRRASLQWRERVQEEDIKNEQPIGG